MKQKIGLLIYRFRVPAIGEDIPPLIEAIAAFKGALVEVRYPEDHLHEVLTKEGGWLEWVAPEHGPAGTRILPLGSGQAATRAGGCRGL